MAEGLRVRHTELRPPEGHEQMIVAVRDLTERIPNPRNVLWPGCSICSLPSPGHEGYKTRHVTIDRDGYGLVSAGVWEGLCHLGDQGGFELENTITNPPKQTLSFDGNGHSKLTVHHRLQRPITTRRT